MKMLTSILLVGALIVSLCDVSNSQIAWTREASSPVISPSCGFEWSRAHDACVVKEGSILRMWYNGNDGIGEAISIDNKHWYKSNNNPVIIEGRGASVIKDSEGYKMYYYTGPDYSHSINLATSADGYSWTVYPGNPVLSKGTGSSWESIGVWNPNVVFEDSVYKMWYQSYDGAFSSVGYATSLDGYTWTKYPNNPVLEHGDAGSFDYLTAGQPSVIWSGSRYDMLYTSTSASMANKVGYAVSSDGIHWTKYAGNPVLSPSLNLWENTRVAAGGLLFENGEYHLWYSAQDFYGYWQVGHATAPYDSAIVDAIINEGGQNGPLSTSLRDAYPNPFNPTSTIQYSLGSRKHVRLKIFDVLGKEIQTLVDETQSAGIKSYVFDGSTLPTGVYFSRLETYGNEDQGRATIQSKKLVLVK